MGHCHYTSSPGSHGITATNYWLQKNDYVHALYPPNCTDDTIRTDSGESIISQSVFGQPTRFATLDGMAGRSDVNVFVQQPRRAAPGWDGCRDRWDGRNDLPAELVWKQPSQRAGHRMIFSDRHRLMLVYGGTGTVREQLPALDITHETQVNGDMWQFHIDVCPKNCSDHGSCWFGHCYCDEGFYGVDCSNCKCCRLIKLGRI